MDKSYTTSVLVKRLAKTVKHLIPAIATAVLFAVLGFLTTVLIPALLVRLVFLGLAGQSLPWLTLASLVLLGLGRGLFRYLEHFFGHFVAFHTLADFRKMMFHKLRLLSPSKLDQQDSGSLLKMVGEDIEAMEVFFAHTIPPVSTAIVVTILLLGFYASQSWYLALLAAVTYFLLAVLFPNAFSKSVTPLVQKQNAERHRYVSQFSESLAGMKDLLQFGKTESYFNNLETLSQDVNTKEKAVAERNYMQSVSTFLVIGMSITLASIINLLAFQNGQVSLEMATTMTVVFISSFAPYLELSRLPLGFKRALRAAAHVFELLDEEEKDLSGDVLNEAITSIRLENVKFSYEGRQDSLFDEINFEVTSPSLIGLIGESGSGKTTIMKLMMRWLETNEGKIFLNEKSIKSLDAYALQSHFAYIPQRPQIFSQSLRENLKLSDDSISDDDIWEILDQTGLKQRVESLPDGLDTILNAEAIQFSAGERQRLELTRALLRKVDVYIFDEPTSNLDALNEAQFLNIVKERCQGIVFIISHRQSTLASVDTIYRLEDGKLINEE